MEKWRQLTTYLMAAVSSVTPSPFAPKSLTFRKTGYVDGLGLKAAVPWCVIFWRQNGSPDAAVPEASGDEQAVPCSLAFVMLRATTRRKIDVKTKRRAVERIVSDTRGARDHRASKRGDAHIYIIYRIPI